MALRRRPQRGFTIIELLVVIAIIAILLALLMPAIQKARAAMDRLTCGSNLRQLAIAAHHYHNDYDKFPPGFVVSPVRSSWTVFLLPYIEEDVAFRNYRHDLAWDDPLNQPVVSRQIKLFICPTAGIAGQRDSLSGGQNYGLCDYSPITDIDPNLIATGLLYPWAGNPQGIMDYAGARIAEVYDGLSNTILLAEVAGRPNWYRKGQYIGETEVAGWASYNNITPINLDGTSADGTTLWGPCAVNCNNIHEVYSLHAGGANVVMGDSRVVFLKQSISIKVMAALVTRDGYEQIVSEDFE